VLEGIDGAGKTVQVARLAAWLRERGRSVVETREPTDGKWGSRYRAWARGEFEASADDVLDMFVYDRREHVEEVIAPALASDRDVVCDRYIASTLVYQAAQGIDRARLIARFEAESFPAADLTLWLRLPVDQAMQRMGANATERFERADFLKRVDAQYAQLNGLVPVDASGDVDEVAALLRTATERALFAHGR